MVVVVVVVTIGMGVSFFTDHKAAVAAAPVAAPAAATIARVTFDMVICLYTTSLGARAVVRDLPQTRRF